MNTSSRLAACSGLILTYSLAAMAPTADADEVLPRDAQNLKGIYEREVERVLKPVQDKYNMALEQLLRRHTSAGQIDEALAVGTESESAQEWETLPLERFRSEARSSLTRDGFKQWLTTKRLFFRGVNAVTLEFDENQVQWSTGGRPQAYDYRVTGNRRATIFGAQDFKLEFSDDLASGTFQSNLGEYELTIEDRR